MYSIGVSVVFIGNYINLYLYLLYSQQTQNICMPFVQRRPNVFNVGPTLYKSYTNVWCLLCYWRAMFTMERDQGQKHGNTLRV